MSTPAPTGYEADIPLDQIFSDHEFNCRGDSITPGSVIELAEEIASNPIGLMQRILLQTYTHEFNAKIKYSIVAGHRRYAAIKLLSKTNPRWKVIPSVVFVGLSNEDAEVINLSENLNRKDLNMLQEANAVDKMYSRGMPPKEIAERLKMSTRWVQDRLTLLKLPEDVRQEAAAGIIKPAHVQELYQYFLKSPDQMYEGVRAIKNAGGRRVIKVKVQAPQTPTVKREYRPMSDIFKMQDTCTEALGVNLASKAFAYAIGEIGAIDLLEEVRKECVMMGISWSIPADYIEQQRRDELALHNAERLKSIEVGA